MKFGDKLGDEFSEEFGDEFCDEFVINLWTNHFQPCTNDEKPCTIMSIQCLNGL